MDQYFSIFYMLTISFPEALVVSFFVIIFIGGSPRLQEIILIALIQTVIAYIVRAIPIPMGMHTLLQTISYIVLISVITRNTILASSVGVVAAAIIFILSEILVTQLVKAATGLTMVDLVKDEYNRLLFTVPATVLMLAITILFRKNNITFIRITGWNYLRLKYNVNTEHGISLLYRKYLPAMVFVFLPLLLLWLFNFTHVPVQLGSYGDYDQYFFKGWFNVLIIFLSFMSLWTVQRMGKYMDKEMEAANAEETISRLKELILSIRKQRHDFNNQLQVVYGLIQMGKCEKAGEFIERTNQYISGPAEIIKTDNYNISALLYTKLGVAEARGIRFDISIDCSLKSFPLKANEVGSLLGNLIDNAFDAVENNSGGDKLVSLEVSLRDAYLVRVSNKSAVEITDDIFSPGFTTKKGHSGLGMTIVKDIVEKYKGCIRAFSEEDFVEFKITIPK
ncbi:MAG: sensor histidine kinase [Bacillota bacterium]